MAWYRLDLPVRSADLDAKINQYRDTVQTMVARLGGRDMRARVFCRREASGDAQVFLEIDGKQPASFMLMLMRCQAIDAPPRDGLELLGEVANGGATLSGPGRPA